MPPNTVPGRSILGEAWVMLWHLLSALPWLAGGRREQGKWCWTVKRTLAHLCIDLAVCTGGFFLKEAIYRALTANIPVPSSTYLNVSVLHDSNIRSRFRAIRDTHLLSPMEPTHFVDLTLFIPPHKAP